MTDTPLLSIENLSVNFRGPWGIARAVRGLDLSIAQGEIHGLVGESGSGKSVTSLSILRLVPPPGEIEGGRIFFEGEDMLELPARAMREARGRRLGIVFQEPAKHFNPSFTVREQVAERVRRFLGLGAAEARARVASLFESVGLPPEKRLLSAYPHELSGGMRQRAMIALAVSCGPRLLIADEPTTALDATLQKQILGLIEGLRERLSMGVLLISHDLGVVRAISGRISVMYAGRRIETGATADLFRSPLHPYTRLLLDSIPDPRKRGMRLATVPGKAPDAREIPKGCSFHPRCPIAEEICATLSPELGGRGQRDRQVACHMVGKKGPA